MKVYRTGCAPTPGKFGGTTTMTAELDEANLDAHEMRPTLERFGRDLAEQMAARYALDSGREVIGVTLHAIEFSLLLEPRKP